jgi:hypothetical protein
MSSESPTLEELSRTTSPPEWLLEMHDHYAETGAFRVEDVLRVLGDPKKGVDMASEESARAFFGLSDLTESPAES